MRPQKHGDQPGFLLPGNRTFQDSSAHVGASLPLRSEWEPGSPLPRTAGHRPWTREAGEPMLTSSLGAAQGLVVPAPAPLRPREFG